MSQNELESKQPHTRINFLAEDFTNTQCGETSFRKKAEERKKKQDTHWGVGEIKACPKSQYQGQEVREKLLVLEAISLW